MAGKRSASSDLNHDNWDQDEEPEDSGTFQKASEDSLKRRIIKTARRRNPISSVRTADPGNKSAFTGFTAFSKPSTPTTQAFPFLTSTTNQTEKPKTNGTSRKTDNNHGSTSNSPKESSGRSNEYFSKLKGLNESVSNWIKKHVDTNPFINLQPIFKDYEKHFRELDKKEESNADAKTTKVDSGKKNENVSSLQPLNASSFVFKAAENIQDSTTRKSLQKNSDKTITSNDTPKFSFGSNSSPLSLGSKSSFGFSSTATSNTFSFASSNLSTLTQSTVCPTFSFEGSTPTPSSTGFSFSGSKPFTFVNVSQPSSTENVNKEKQNPEEDEEEPPKVEFTPVVEKDHIYTTRCKVFVKKDSSFGDRGVGNLYLKPIENSNKVQLIVRADTNLGNLLCNFILSESIPIKRMGMKDVMLVCLPMPDVKPPPIPILLRVKSSDEADNLLDVLEKHKK